MSIISNEIRHISSDTFTADIYIAGSLNAAREACREFCLRGLCVSITPSDFVFTGGMESGVRVGLINYPRFPKSPDEIWSTAVQLAEFLILRLHQGSATVIAPDTTCWLSRREFDK